MNDPHVDALHYRIETPEGVRFIDPQPVDAETDVFHVHLENGEAVVTMTEHYASVEDARAVVEPFLRAWEVTAGLERGRQELSFVYRQAQVVDRRPTAEGGPPSMHFHGSISIKASVALELQREQYPSPPQSFAVSPDVETLWERYEGYIEGREPLLPMAYFCLSVLELLAGGERNAPAYYGVSRQVLTTLSRIASTRGSSAEARKLSQESDQQPLTPDERVWVEAVIKALIRRVGKLAYDPSGSYRQLTMADFP